MVVWGTESGVIVTTNQRGQIVRRVAPAKINLTLAVSSRRPDGYHEIESWVVKIAWCDRVTVAVSEKPSLTLEGTVGGIPADDTNLAFRAARLLADAANRPADFAIHLEKEIPAGGGLGGGSSNAAAVLLALNDLWGLSWRIEQLTPVAAAIGSDVPLFLREGSVVIRGRGELVRQLPRCWGGWVAMIVPPYSIPTAAVYEQWTSPGERQVDSKASPQPWRDPDLNARELMARLFNNLEPAAFAVEPRLHRLHQSLHGLDDRPVRMTGSGSCLFTLFDKEEAESAWIKYA